MSDSTEDYEELCTFCGSTKVIDALENSEGVINLICPECMDLSEYLETHDSY